MINKRIYMEYLSLFMKNWRRDYRLKCVKLDDIFICCTAQNKVIFFMNKNHYLEYRDMHCTT